MKTQDEYRAQVDALRTRAAIRRKIRAEDDRIAKQLDQAAESIETLLDLLVKVANHVI